MSTILSTAPNPFCSIRLKLYPQVGRAFLYPDRSLDVTHLATEKEVDDLAADYAEKAKHQLDMTFKRVHIIRYKCNP